MLHCAYIPRKETFQLTIVESCHWVRSGKDHSKNVAPDNNNGHSQKEITPEN